MKQPFHIPGRPTKPEPAKLVDIAASVTHPDIVSGGITTTKRGDWALLVTVQKDTAVPIKEIEKNLQDFRLFIRRARAACWLPGRPIRLWENKFKQCGSLPSTRKAYCKRHECRPYHNSATTFPFSVCLL